MAHEGTRCRWGEGRGRPGEGNEVIAESGVKGRLRTSGGQVKDNAEGTWESGDEAAERDRETDIVTVLVP